MIEIKSETVFPKSERKVVDATKPNYKLIQSYAKALEIAEQQVKETVEEYKQVMEACEGQEPIAFIKSLKEKISGLEGQLETEKQNTAAEKINAETAVSTEKVNSKKAVEQLESQHQEALGKKDDRINELKDEIEDLKTEKAVLASSKQELLDKQEKFKTKVITDIKAKAGHNNPLKVQELAVKIVEQAQF